MQIKRFIRGLSIFSVIFFFNSCQKDSSNDNIKYVDICPEVTMGNFEEVGLILNDYLNNQTGNSESENFEQLSNYLESCACIQSVRTLSEKISANTGFKELELRFKVNSDTIAKTMDLIVFEDGRLEFSKFHE